MIERIEMYDVVALTENLPEKNLKKGEEGTVVLILAPNVFEVEFCDSDGITYAMTAIEDNKLSVIWKAQK
ncbi:MAG TPA: DUF4926 domain-containing protein [Pyrinomonadaceae bacterium]|nr:DUF4926 domain-containing protein [Pyrinomonadaceae bacterium]